MNDHSESLIDVDAERNGKGNGSRGLLHRHDGVNKGVHNAADDKGFDENGGQPVGRIGAQVEPSDCKPRKNVLHVVSVSATHSLNVRVVKGNSRDALFALHCPHAPHVFIGDEYLE